MTSFRFRSTSPISRRRLLPIRDQMKRNTSSAQSANGKMVCVIKSVGGIGATALLTQLAIKRSR